ncbi:histidinol-phosphate transaminase [Croceiramulus getboli]|nr:histidinol-phosphate transaminase [Flavobacteriaceae bacterium YJPT1-3]
MNKASFDLNALVRENVRQMKPYSSARDEFTDFEADMVFLDANENPFENGVNRYPDPRQRNLKAQLSKVKRVPMNQILLGNGSDEVLDLIVRAFCEPGRDNIITLPPTYGMYKVLAATNAVECREVLLTENFQIDLEGVRAAVDGHTKIIFLCSPNNPTGNLLQEEEVRQILESFNGLVVIDEAYIDFASSKSWSQQLSDYPNLIVCQTLSKAYGLAGIRLGMCFATEEVIAVLQKIKPPYNVNELTQKSALERVLDQKTIKDEITLILVGKEELSKALLEVNFVDEVFPSEANFILARVQDANRVYQQLIDLGVVVRNRSTQPRCESTLRFTVGTPEENKKLINALKTLNT